MTTLDYLPAPESFDTLGALLLFLRKRAQLTQEELARATGYSRTHIARFESNQRVPDATTLTALMFPALGVADVPQLGARLLELAQGSSVTLTRTVTESVTVHHHTPNTVIHYDNLPAPMLPLMGREAEIAQLQEWLSDSAPRLVTVVGAPGVGKTRTTLEAAWRLEPLFRDGVAWVELAACKTPAEVVATVASTLGIRTGEGQDTATAIRQRIRGGAFLLVLDNFEQVVAAAPLVAEWLAASPRLRVLVTSRVPLHIYGEYELTLEPLQEEAVALFVARARAVRTDFALTSRNEALIAELCRHLDGLPLAIELAAAQIRTFPLETLLERSRDPLLWLTEGPTNQATRHHTLRNAIAWSMTHLEPAAQRLFNALALFASGFTEEGAKLFGSPPTLHTLVAANLVQAHEVTATVKGDGTVASGYRYRLLETLRAYAVEQVASYPDLQTMHYTYARYWASLLENVHPVRYAARLPRIQSHLQQEMPNIRAAMTWAIPNEPALALTMLDSLTFFYYLWGQYQEGIEWLEQALAATPPRTPKRNLLFRGLGLLYRRAGYYERALMYLEQALAAERLNGNAADIALAATEVASWYIECDNAIHATPLLQEAYATYEKLALVAEQSWVLSLLAYCFNQEGELRRAQQCALDSVAKSRLQSDQRHFGWMLGVAGDFWREWDVLERAHSLYDEGIAVMEAVGDIPGQAFNRMRLGALLLQQGQIAEAERLLTEAYRLAVLGETPSYIGQSQAYQGLLAAEQGDLVKARQRIQAGMEVYPDTLKRLLPYDQAQVAKVLTG